jgi:hypothetical protein
MNPRLLVNGSQPVSASFHAKVRRVTRDVQLASVYEYADPITSDSHAEVGHYVLGRSEVIEGTGDNVAVTLDLSSISVPDSCWFESVMLDAGRVVDARVRLIGIEGALRSPCMPIQIRYSFSGNQGPPDGLGPIQST